MFMYNIEQLYWKGYSDFVKIIQGYNRGDGEGGEGRLCSNVSDFYKWWNTPSSNCTYDVHQKRTFTYQKHIFTLDQMTNSYVWSMNF